MSEIKKTKNPNLFSETFHDLVITEESEKLIKNWVWFREIRSQVLKQIEEKLLIQGLDYKK